MRVVTLATQKGGSGKSTLAANLGVQAEKDGYRIALLDTDPQGTLYKWGERRAAETPVVDRCEPHQLEAVLKALPKRGFDAVIIDTAGAHNPSVAPAILAANFVLVPVKPTLLDLEAAVPTARQLRDRKVLYAFVLNQCFGSSGRLLDASTALLKHGGIVASSIHQRADFADAITDGLGVSEYNPSGKAAQEIALLWGWLRQAAGLKERIDA